MQAREALERYVVKEYRSGAVVLGILPQGRWYHIAEGEEVAVEWVVRMPVNAFRPDFVADGVGLVEPPSVSV